MNALKEFNLKFLGKSIEMGNACYPVGQCVKNTLVQNYTLYDKTYTIDDSIILRALSIRGSKMIDGNYITVIPNVKDKVPLYREDMDIWYESEATGGKGKNDCGPFNPHGRIDVVTDKFLHVHYMTMEVAICYKKLIGTFRQSLLKPGANFTDENDALNNRVLDNMVRNSNKQIDMLIWMGDYLSPIKLIAHYDGLVKRIFNAISTYQNQTFEISTTTDLIGGDVIEGKFGGHTFSVPFNTDHDTTMSDLITEFSGYNHPITCQPLVTVSYDGAGTITMISNYDMLPIEFFLGVSTGDGVEPCNGNYVGIPTTAGTGLLAVTETINWKAVDRPMTIPFTPISSANVIQEITKLYLKVASEHPQMLTESDFYIHVSPQVFAQLQVATSTLTAAITGLTGVQANPTPFGLRIVEQPGLMYHVMVGTMTKNIFFGTDLLSDRNLTRQWVNIDCEEVRFRHGIMQGVQVDRFSETVSNLDCAPLKFQAAMNEGGSVLNPCA